MEEDIQVDIYSYILYREVIKYYNSEAKSITFPKNTNIFIEIKKNRWK